MTITADFVIRQGDTLPRFAAQILDADGVPVDLSGASVALHLHGMTMTKDISIPASIAESAEGKVFYDWSAGDTTLAGYFSAEFQVTFGNGQVQTFPNDRHFVVQVAAQVA